MAEESFKLPGSSYAELVKIIRAYGHSPDEAVPKDVADRSGVSPSQVSRSNAFLVSIGVLSGGKRKSLTSAGRKLAQALDFEMPDQIETVWREIVNENDFLRRVVSAVQIRGGMEISSLKNHVAYSAGAPKTAFAMAGAGSIIDILRAAAHLREDDGKIVATTRQDDNSIQIKKDEPIRKKGELPGAPSVQNNAQKPFLNCPITTSITIQVRVDCKLEELTNLGDKLRNMIISLKTDKVICDANEE